MSLDEWGMPRRDDPRAWTPAELSTLRRMAPTHSWEEVAAAIGRSKWAVKGKAAKLRISFRKHGELHHATRYSTATLERIHTLRAQGWSHQRIADELGMSKQHAIFITTHAWRYREFMQIEASHDERD